MFSFPFSIIIFFIDDARVAPAAPYGTSVSAVSRRLPPSVRSHGLMMDPHGTMKSMSSHGHPAARPGMKVIVIIITIDA